MQTDLLQRIDFAYLLKDTTAAAIKARKIDKHDQEHVLKTMALILKSLDYLQFFSKDGIETKGRSFIQVLSEVMSSKLAMDDNDRDLVVMVHEFVIKSKDREWKRTSTMIASGESKASGGLSIMGKTVGYTCGVATRMVLEKKIPQRGVLSPIYPEIYGPLLAELDSMGIRMKEEE